MNERWRQIERIYHAARELGKSARVEFLAKACAGDADLRREVESLLVQADQDASFLETAAIEVAAGALAVVTYEALAGAYPFVGTTLAELSRAVLAGQTEPISRHVPEAPAGWQAFFVRALSLDSAARPSSAAEFFSQLDQVLR